MKKIILLLVIVATISGALAALPCNSRLRMIRPRFFKHCENTCAYGEWSTWRIVDQTQSENCERKNALVQTRIRHSFTKNCSSQNETKYTYEDIDGDVFLQLTTEEIDELAKKLGVTKKLKQLQDSSQNYLMVTYGEKSYCLSNVPSKNDYVVVEAAKEIEGHLRLQNLGNDLSTLGRFVRIAHFGVAGHIDLQLTVRTSLRSVFELCHNTAHTLNDFKRNSHEALEILQTAYRYLDEALEEQALKILLSLQEMSIKMKEEVSKLSQKCNEQSKNIKGVGDTTLHKKDEVKKEKEINESKIEKLNNEKQQTDEDIKNAEDENTEAKSELQSECSKKENAMDELIQATKENQKKKAEFMAGMDKTRQAIITDYKEQIAKAEQDFASNKVEIERKYSEKLQASKKRFNASTSAADKQYETVLAENVSILKENLNSNEKWLTDEEEIIKKKYENTISIDCKDAKDKIRDIENDYNSEVRRIDQQLKSDLKSNQEIMESRLKENQEMLNVSLDGNTEQCKASKDKIWLWQTKAHAELASSKAQKDVDAKTAKAAADKAAREDRIKADDQAKTTHHTQRQDENDSKVKKLQPYNDTINEIMKEAFVKQKKEKDTATNKKHSLDEEAQKKKENNDITAKNQKNEKIAKAEEAMQTADENALNEKDAAYKEAKSANDKKMERIKEEYEAETKRLDKVEEDFKNTMQTTIESYKTKIGEIKEKKIRNQKLIDESKENKRKAQKEMRKVIQQLTQCKSRAEIHNVTAESLQEAIKALNEIEVIMINVGNFWKGVETLCASVTGESMKKQVDMLSTMEPHERKIIWRSKAFKVEALNSYGKWIALKDVCTKAGKNVNSALDEVRSYIIENPKEDKAFESVQEMAGKFLKELPEDTE